MCDHVIKLQLLDHLREADQSPSIEPPGPVLLLEHCTEVAAMMRNYQLAATQSVERRHFTTHWGAQLSTYLHYVLGQRDRAMGRAT